jgi:Na+/proline symporter
VTIQHDLGDRLSELEPFNPDFRAKYAHSLKDIFERKLSWTMKVFVGAVGAASIGIAIFLASVALAHPELPALAHIGLVGGAAFSLAWAALAGWTLRKGTWFGRIQPAVASALAWIFAVFLETLFLVLAPLAPDPYLWTVAILAGMVILLGAGFQLIGVRLQHMELTMRESFLRMEYRLAELAEVLAKNQQE